MVEFRYNISGLFPQPIIRVTSNLLPHTFRGDRREALDAAVKMSEIIDRLGQLSAVAQKLNRPVTTSQRVRMSENQTVYLLADVNEGQHGVVVGLLKIGTKDLYLFDESGETRKVEQAPCILDFYIHESRQRHGLGKKLFQTMLGDEKWTPLHCCVDRPSDKLLGFLRKHYSLQKPIPQANNFVVYEGFFGGGNGAMSHQDGGGDRNKRHTNGVQHSASPNTQLFGNAYLGEEINKRRQHRQLANSPATVQVVSPAGRYGARRPTCSMAEKGTASEVSLTPSQASELAKQNARKNPLDALSRMSLRHSTYEKRSGLQDVDDEYFKKNVFSKSIFPRHSGLNDNYTGQSPLAPTESTYKLQTSGDAGQMSAQQQQQQQMQQQQQQYQQQPPQQQSQMQMNQGQQQQQYQQQPQMSAKIQQQQHMQQQPQGQMQQQTPMQQNPSMGQPQMQRNAAGQERQAQMPNIIHSNSQQPNKAVQDASSIYSGSNQAVDGLTKEFSSMQTLSGDPDEERERERELLSDQEEYGEPAIESLEPDPSERRHFNKRPVDHIGNECLAGCIGGASKPEEDDGVADPSERRHFNKTPVDHIGEPAIESLEPGPSDRRHFIKRHVDHIGTECLAGGEPAIESAEPDQSDRRHFNKRHVDHISNEPAIESLEPDPSERRHFNKAPADHIGNEYLGGSVRKTTFQLSKQHTGMKNVSYGVGQAVAPTNKMEFDQEQREDFGVVKINRPIGKSPSSLAGDAADNESLSSSAAAAAAAAEAGGLTDQGYYDLKFYHNKLW